jgi:hypothetical protein
MTTVTVDGQVAASVEKVFAVFTDLERSAERVTNIQSIEMLTHGGFVLGTRWRETREVLGQRDSADMEVTAFERNRTYTITHHKAGARMDTVFTFEPVADATNVRIEFGLDSHGLPPGLAMPIRWAIAATVRDELTRDLADLKHYTETARTSVPTV